MDGGDHTCGYRGCGSQLRVVGFFPCDAVQLAHLPIFVRHASLIFTVSDSLQLSFDHVSASSDGVDWTRVRIVGECGHMRRNQD